MCEYQKVNFYGKSKLPICDYTKSPCTYCIYGNADTYQKAEKDKRSKIND